MFSSLTLFFLAALTCAAVVYLVWIGYDRVRSAAGSTEHKLCLTLPQDVHDLLSSLSHEQIRSRAIPNERLVRAFQITNTFVSDSVDIHSAFTREARALLRATGSKPRDWFRFADHVQTAIDTYITFTHGRQCCEYEPFVQYVTFTTILTSLFGIDIYPSPGDVLVVTQGINDLWRLSKTGNDMPPAMLETINMHLRAWIHAYPNPLDFILPTFETMWRVVAVAVALAHKDVDMRKTFAQFIAHPTSSEFERSEVDAPSVEAIIAETMRLHPPTRRIHRANVVPHTSTSTLFLSVFTIPAFIRFTPSRTNIVADIGAIHRDTDIWGDDADVFRPQRHHPDTLTAEQRGAFMPFGYGRLKCVASGWAPHAAGMIVGEVLRALEETYRLREGGQVGGRAGWNGWELEVIAN